MKLETKNRITWTELYLSKENSPSDSDYVNEAIKLEPVPFEVRIFSLENTMAPIMK